MLDEAKTIRDFLGWLRVGGFEGRRIFPRWIHHTGRWLDTDASADELAEAFVKARAPSRAKAER